jgi:septum formation protein
MNSKSYTFVLASASPRRFELLSHFNFPFKVISADIDETSLPDEAPDRYVKRLSHSKATAVAEKLAMEKKSDKSFFILAADTTVVLEEEIIGKPDNEDHAVEMLLKLQGKTHSVLSAYYLLKLETFADFLSPPNLAVLDDSLQTNQVTFDSFSREEAKDYVSKNESMDKAGAYAMQGIGGQFISGVQGSITSVMGLDMCALRRSFNKFDIVSLCKKHEP